VTGMFWRFHTSPARPGWNPQPCTRCGHIHLGVCTATSTREYTWTGKACGCLRMVHDEPESGDAA
jgi:hypothetical protein